MDSLKEAADAFNDRNPNSIEDALNAEISLKGSDPNDIEDEFARLLQEPGFILQAKALLLGQVTVTAVAEKPENYQHKFYTLILDKLREAGLFISTFNPSSQSDHLRNVFQTVFDIIDEAYSLRTRSTALRLPE